MAETNHTLPTEEDLARALTALSIANDLSVCIYYVAEEFQENPENRGIALTVAQHLSQLLCWHLDVVQRALDQGPGFGSFESDLVDLSR